MRENKPGKPNLVQTQIFRDVSEKVKAWLETGEPVMPSEQFRVLRYRAQLLRPVKVAILHVIAGLIRTGEWSLSDGIELAKMIFGRKYIWFWENQILAEIDVLAEEVVQAERRQTVDLPVLEKAMSAFTPDALEAERLAIRQEGVYWGRALQDIGSPYNPMNLSLVRQVQENVDNIEVEIENILRDIIEINQLVKDLKATALEVEDWEVLDLAEEIKLLDQLRSEKRERLEEKRVELKQSGFSWLCSAEQVLEFSAREILNRISALEKRELEIDELLGQSSQEVSVPEPDELHVFAEANLNVAERLLAKAEQDRLPRYKQKGLIALAGQLVERAIILEV